jgi:mannose-6-phosphate isomerase-like protein (cupin superfamily)
MTKPAFKPQRQMWSKQFTYDFWMESVGIPIHRGFYIQDLRTIELSWWEERKAMSAFIQLAGQEGVSAARVTEIPPGQTLPPLKFALDEVVYVVSGRGLTNIWYDNSGKKSFEWQQHSMFQIPHGSHHQLSNMQGDKPVRLLHYSYFPLALSAVPDPDFFFNNPYPSPNELAEHEGYYSEAKMVHMPQGADPKGRQVYWYGNFFPDMKAWEKLDANERRGAGGKSV